MDWFNGKFTGKPHIYWENLWFPVNFPIIQFYDFRCSWLVHTSNSCASARLWSNSPPSKSSRKAALFLVKSIRCLTKVPRPHGMGSFIWDEHPDIPGYQSLIPTSTLPFYGLSHLSPMLVRCKPKMKWYQPIFPIRLPHNIPSMTIQKYLKQSDVFVEIYIYIYYIHIYIYLFIYLYLFIYICRNMCICL